MKTNLLNISLFVLLSAVSLCGCGNDDEPVATATDSTTLTVIARADGFASTDGTAQTGTPQTRASESNYTTTFVKGDQIGVFAVKNSNVMADCKNLPFTYNGATWSSSTPIYKDADITYFAYYPYTAGMDNKTSVNEIVEAFNTAVSAATDQSTYTKYTACDLMTTADAVSPTGTSLSFSFTHRMSLIEISLPVQKYKTSNSADAYKYSGPVLNPAFSFTPSSGGDVTMIQPCPMGNGIYRYIVPAGASGATISGVFNTADGKTIEYLKDNLSLSAGNYKRLNVTSGASSTTPTVRALAVGDFYYSDGSIYPKDAGNPPSEGCIGVVYWVGNNAVEEDPLLKANHPGCTHGLVASLRDVSNVAWSSEHENITNEWLSKLSSSTYGITTLKATDKMQGYANTQALDGYNKSDRVAEKPGRKVLPIDLIQTYADSHPAPANSSGWYFPSVRELKYMCWGQNAIDGTGGKQMLDTQFAKVSGSTSLSPSLYWSSTEGDDYDNAWYVYFQDGNASKNYNKNYSCSLRAVLAF